MSILTELIVRGVLVVALNDAIIFYWINKHSRKITIPLGIGIIVITCIALVINIWFCLYRSGIK